MAHVYANNELVDMLLMYGECHQPAAETSRNNNLTPGPDYTIFKYRNGVYSLLEQVPGPLGPRPVIFFPSPATRVSWCSLSCWQSLSAKEGDRRISPHKGSLEHHNPLQGHFNEASRKFYTSNIVLDMSRKLQVNRLDKDELSYELTVRGIATGTCEEMRRRLSQALQLEKSGDSLKYPEYPYTFEEDHET
ncbi:hypothetical protein NQ317_014782 [Molorchus minor]|uniref:Uncharacterized protein n=1 Tax=Molorchus minor TaxID=1323400 RepID=A0ABQ9JSF4_9CUCU|nr:hypothetical protein NQ317_014782 [Molorchus minor]